MITTNVVSSKKVFRTPRITTRGCYDLATGKEMRHGSPLYRLYPKRYFADLDGVRELVVMVHGLRNDDRGASEKVSIARRMLERTKRQDPDTYRVVGFSYDSNTRGAHLARSQKNALAVGRRIARANGRRLASFIVDFKRDSAHRKTKVRLVGHSLGTEVLFHTIVALARMAQSGTAPPKYPTHGAVESVHFFGSSLSDGIQRDASVRRAIDYVVRTKLLNYYAPNDDVLLYAKSAKIISAGTRTGRYGGSLGLCGAAAGTPVASKYRQKRLNPENHRFASYADSLRVFP